MGDREYISELIWAMGKGIYEARPALVLHPEERVIPWSEAEKAVPERVAECMDDARAALSALLPVLAEPSEGMLSKGALELQRRGYMYQGTRPAGQDIFAAMLAHLSDALREDGG
ncbi:MAG: hypothetical protein AAGK02_07195 [Pseudomonadota bacterium]